MTNLQITTVLLLCLVSALTVAPNGFEDWGFGFSASGSGFGLGSWLVRFVASDASCVLSFGFSASREGFGWGHSSWFSILRVVGVCFVSGLPAWGWHWALGSVRHSFDLTASGLGFGWGFPCYPNFRSNFHRIAYLASSQNTGARVLNRHFLSALPKP